MKPQMHSNMGGRRRRRRKSQTDGAQSNRCQSDRSQSNRPQIDRPIVLVGLMGAGKTTVGRRLADYLGLDFTDSDAHIEAAADLTIAEIFELYGEAKFREVEHRVIARLLGEGPRVIATGGGAFMNGETRRLIAERATSIWLKADLAILVERTARRTTRPLLNQGDPEEILSRLIQERHPIYAHADITIDASQHPHERAVHAIVDALCAHNDLSRRSEN